MAAVQGAGDRRLVKTAEISVRVRAVFLKPLAAEGGVLTDVVFVVRLFVVVGTQDNSAAVTAAPRWWWGSSAGWFRTRAASTSYGA